MYLHFGPHLKKSPTWLKVHLSRGKVSTHRLDNFFKSFINAEGHPGGFKSGQFRTNKQIDPESLPVI